MAMLPMQSVLLQGSRWCLCYWTEPEIASDEAFVVGPGSPSDISSKGGGVSVGDHPWGNQADEEERRQQGRDSRGEMGDL
jgi:hypothetical protein